MKRYYFVGPPDYESEEGHWVRWEDVAKLIEIHNKTYLAVVKENNILKEKLEECYKDLGDNY